MAKSLKQGQTEKITTQDEEVFKVSPIVKKTMVLTMKDGKPKRVFYDDSGKYIGEEDVE